MNLYEMFFITLRQLFKSKKCEKHFKLSLILLPIHLSYSIKNYKQFSIHIQYTLSLFLFEKLK